MNKNNSIMKNQSGLSLVELSVVLVIIGIIVGIVAAGVTIQKTSELRSIITQVDQFRIAIESFEDKYEDLPGDMTDAHDYWDDGSDTECGTAAQCNGDGDGDIDLGSGNDSESLRAWQHLNLGGFIEGEFTGEGTGTTHVIFENCPGTARTGGGYHLQTMTNNVHTVNETALTVGGFNSSTWPNQKLLTPAEAYFIDNKTDDGDPDNGKTESRDYASQNGCLDDDDDDDGRQYEKTEEDQLCIMFFDIR